MTSNKAYENLINMLESKDNRGIKCAHINVNGLHNKIEEIKLLLNETKFDILAITETHLHKNLSEDAIAIDNYSIIRKDRFGHKNHWGGVLFYYQNHLEIHQLDLLPPTVNIEAIFLELITKSQKLLVGCIYRPPDYKDFLGPFNQVLDIICHRANILLLGDFNIDLSKANTPLSTEFKQILAAANLTNIIRNHTRITDKSKSLIDLAITADQSKINQRGSFETGISDHDLIFATVNLFKPKAPPKIIIVRNYRQINIADVRKNLELVPWHIMDIFDDVDDKVWCWNRLFKDTISDHVKTRKVKVRSNNQPWMTGEIRKSINSRYKLLKKARNTPSKSNEWLAYKKARNVCTNLIRYAKANYWRNEFAKSDSVKSFWSTVRKFQGVTKTQKIGPLKHNDSVLLNDFEKAELINNFFANVGKDLATCMSNESAENPNSYIYRITPTVSNININADLLTKSFRSTVKLGKACGADNITSNDLKLHKQISIESLQSVIQCSLTTGKFPTDWKKAKVTAIYKKGCKSNCSNYRPISLLSIPSKILEHLICSQLTAHLREHNLQNEHQWGFRPSRSTEDVLLYLTEKWRKAIDSGKVVGVLFVDFKKAFDSVSHQILLRKLSACGVSGQFLSFLESYLTNRSQFTVVNGTQSNEADVEFGIPQGSLVGPPCFSINVNDMEDNIDCDLDQFADDSTAHTVADSVDEVLINLRLNAEKLQIYAKRNSLTIHPDKCEIIVLSKHRFVGPLAKVELGGKIIEIVHSSKCLGLTIDQNLTWETHIQNISKGFSQKHVSNERYAKISFIINLLSRSSTIYPLWHLGLG